MFSKGFFIKMLLIAVSGISGLPVIVNGQTAVSYTGFPFISTPLTDQADLSAKMVEGVGRFLLEETDRLKKARPGLWKRDFSSAEAFNSSIASQRELLTQRLGVTDKRVTPHLEILTNKQLQQYSVGNANIQIRAVRWQVLDGLSSEGLLLQPKGKIKARIVMVPDASVVPEIFAGLLNREGPGFGVAQELALAGCEVLIPMLISREDSFSGNRSLGLFTNQPHREWIYRQSYELGRLVSGYELQKIFSALDWFETRNESEGNELPFGVAGHGEGAMLALYAAALDKRISSSLVSGYFDAREGLWQEPIYRNVFGLLKTFGDAELAVMTWPRKLVVEYASAPEVTGPPEATDNRSGATPGRIITPGIESAKGEWNRAKDLVPADKNHLQWIAGAKGSAGKPFSRASLNAFTKALGFDMPQKATPLPSFFKIGEWVDANERQERSVGEMEAHVQRVLALCHRTRDQEFWSKVEAGTNGNQQVKSLQRERFWNVLGKLPAPSVPANAKARLIKETDKWTSYELTLDVFSPDVFAWGILIIPKGIQSGEKRPVVVCQHGLEGVPNDMVTTDTTAENYHYYKGLATRLAEKGYVTFSPHNPYRGIDKFRVLQRKANPIGLTLFSVIISQHQRIVEWLGQQSFADPKRIGFYGLSYGGKTAMRVPAVVEGYALSICSADFNEWVRKAATTDYDFGYIYTSEYDMPEWDLGHTFNYAEMAALIAPRPFMVERGHYDGVAVDEWVDFEFAKVRRYYVSIGLPQLVEIEHFNGPHSINGVGTFQFLDRHLKKKD